MKSQSTLALGALVLSLSVLSNSALAQATANSKNAARVRSALSYLAATQTTGREGYDPGQWRSQVVSILPNLIGVGQYNVPFEEPTAFGAASVANVLAETHLADGRFPEIEAMVAKAKNGLKPYEFGPVYNFYPAYMSEGIKVRGPRFMYLEEKWRGFTNVPPDADSTSVSYLLKSYDQIITEKKVRPYAVNNTAITLLARHRDLDRNAHIFNGHDDHVNTGAFLTWLMHENDPRMPTDYFAPPSKGMRIPFNKNDVDCVVGANVLKMLTAAGRRNTLGYAETCNHLNKIAANDEHFTCGMYYPSSYALPYTMATAMKLGVKCLEPSRPKLVEDILAKQNTDGYWQNDRKARPDYVQSTAWALNTLLILGNPKDPQQRAAVKSGIDFMMRYARKDNRGRMYWEGEVFYAAIFLVRYEVVWRSAPYTTATVVKALSLAESKWGIQ